MKLTHKFLQFGITIISIPSFAFLNTNDISTEQIIKHDNMEICVIPHKLLLSDETHSFHILTNDQLLSSSNFSAYTQKDIKSEVQLCGIQFHNKNTSPKTEVYQKTGICGKTNNTNPAIEAYELSATETIETFEAKQCLLKTEERTADKLGKYKISTSCSYTPSILTYYHFSRILGDLLYIPPSVLRTVDIEKHQHIYRQLRRHLPKGSAISNAWFQMIQQISHKNQGKNANYLLTQSLTHTYGALIENPKGEKLFEELSEDASGNQILRGQHFKSLPIYNDLLRSQKIDQFISREWTSENLQHVSLLGDVSDMLLIDFILRQEDRFNNIAYVQELYGLSNGQIHHLKLRNSDKIEKVSEDRKKFFDKYNTQPEFTIRRIQLKDNDCGLATESGIARSNIVEKLKMLENIHHMKKSTFKKINQLNQALENPTQLKTFKDFFISTTTMTETDFSYFLKNIKIVSKQIKAKCESGKLFLDLDIHDHFINSNKVNKTACE